MLTVNCTLFKILYIGSKKDNTENPTDKNKLQTGLQEHYK